MFQKHQRRREEIVAERPKLPESAVHVTPSDHKEDVLGVDMTRRRAQEDRERLFFIF